MHSTTKQNETKRIKHTHHQTTHPPPACCLAKSNDEFRVLSLTSALAASSSLFSSSWESARKENETAECEMDSDVRLLGWVLGPLEV
jgi:hypothetical protein